MSDGVEETMWSLLLEAAGPASDSGPDVFEKAVHEIQVTVSKWAGKDASATWSQDLDRYSIRLFVASSDVVGAIEQGVGWFKAAADEVDFPEWPLVRILALTEEELDTELKRPRVPKLLGVAELSERLGVTKQRVSELAAGERFPRPISKLAAGPVWLEPTVEHFEQQWSRQPGRPANAQGR